MIVEWTKPMVDRFQVAYDEAVEADVDQFVFEGHELVTEYAKYLLEYLNERFKDA